MHMYLESVWGLIKLDTIFHVHMIHVKDTRCRCHRAMRCSLTEAAEILENPVQPLKVRDALKRILGDRHDIP